MRGDENGGENESIYRCCSTPVTAVIGTIMVVTSY